MFKVFKRLFRLGKAKKDALVDFFVRCPHCETLYALYNHINVATVNDVRCGTCSHAFSTLRNKSAPRNGVDISDIHNPFQPRLSRISGGAVTMSDDFDYTYTPNTQKSATSSSWLKTFSAFSLLAAANLTIVSAMWAYQDSLYQNTFLRGWLVSACGYLDCRLPAYHDPSKMTVQQHQLTSIPNNASVLQLHALIQNNSPYAQPLSNLEMQLDDLQGNSFNKVVFTPKDYAPSNPHLVLEPGQTLHISVVVTQPTPDIFSYELQFI